MDSYTSSVLSVYPVDDRAVESESDGAIQRDITLLSAGYMLIICWSLVVLSRNSWAYTKTHLIMVGTVPLIGLSLMCSFGVASAWGFKVGADEGRTRGGRG